MGALIIKILGLSIIAIGVIAVFDARILSKKFFSSADKKTSIKVLKIVGFIIAILGAIVIYAV